MLRVFINRLKSAAAGWTIISNSSEAREGARHLLIWLAENIVVCSLEFRFVDEQNNYSWTESVEKTGFAIPRMDCEKIWHHPFPTGPSYWIVTGFQGDRDSLYFFLNLLADQWLRVNRLKREGIPGKRLLKIPKRTLVNPSWIAVSRAAGDIRSRLPELSFSTRPLLLLGENGCGKKYLAEIIHNSGPYPSESFSGADSEEKTGTVYVPDWQFLGTEKQIILLRGSRRLIAAAVPGEQIESLIEEWNGKTGGGRESIIKIPPLRNHPEDIPLLSGRFLEQHFVNTGLPVPEISAASLEVLKTYSWPGNVRELKECMAWSVEHFDGKRICVRNLPPAVRGAVAPPRKLSFPEQISALEYEMIMEELIRQKGNISRTAGKIGLSPRQLSCRIKKYNINPRNYKSPGRTS